jgi:hypothetical protein
MRFLLVLFLAVSLHAQAAKGNGGPSVASQMQSTGAHGGGGGRRYEDPRRAPPLDPRRKVNEQDCSKPVNPDGGNLTCK